MLCREMAWYTGDACAKPTANIQGLEGGPPREGVEVGLNIRFLSSELGYSGPGFGCRGSGLGYKGSGLGYRD